MMWTSGYGFVSDWPHETLLCCVPHLLVELIATTVFGGRGWIVA